MKGIRGVYEENDILLLDDCKRKLIEKRLLDNIKITLGDECWNWVGTVFRNSGRASICIGKRYLAYRISYIIFKGEIERNLYVLHTCDNVRCINPEHLFLGTAQDNSDDMIAKGRSLDQTGSKNHASKLNEKLVRLIKYRLHLGDKQNKIARITGVSKATINLIALNKTWMHV